MSNTETQTIAPADVGSASALLATPANGGQPDPTVATETKTYPDGTVATGTPPLPDQSPAMQDAQDTQAPTDTAEITEPVPQAQAHTGAMSAAEGIMGAIASAAEAHAAHEAMTLRERLEADAKALEDAIAEAQVKLAVMRARIGHELYADIIDKPISELRGLFEGIAHHFV